MINLWLAIIAVAASVAAAFLPVFRGIRIPILAFLLAYGVTVVAGAGFLLDESGQAQLKLHMSRFSADSFTTLGGGLYWTLLLAPLALLPVFALAGAKLCELNPVAYLRMIVTNSMFPIRSLWVAYRHGRFLLFISCGLLGARSFVAVRSIDMPGRKRQCGEADQYRLPLQWTLHMAHASIPVVSVMLLSRNMF